MIDEYQFCVKCDEAVTYFWEDDADKWIEYGLDELFEQCHNLGHVTGEKLE